MDLRLGKQSDLYNTKDLFKLHPNIGMAHSIHWNNLFFNIFLQSIFIPSYLQILRSTELKLKRFMFVIKANVQIYLLSWILSYKGLNPEMYKLCQYFLRA